MVYVTTIKNAAKPINSDFKSLMLEMMKSINKSICKIYNESQMYV